MYSGRSANLSWLHLHKFPEKNVLRICCLYKAQSFLPHPRKLSKIVIVNRFSGSHKKNIKTAHAKSVIVYSPFATVNDDSATSESFPQPEPEHRPTKKGIVGCCRTATAQ